MYWEAYYQQLAPITKNPNSGNFYGETPIHWAALNGHLEILKLLVSYTDDPNVPDSQGWTPIHWSANHLGHIDILKLVAPLTKNPNPKSTNFPKRTPFEVAQLKGYHEFARILQTYIKH